MFPRLYKTIHELLTQQLDETEEEIKKDEDIVQVESQPDDPTATHEELSNLQVCLQYLLYTVKNTTDVLQNVNVPRSCNKLVC